MSESSKDLHDCLSTLTKYLTALGATIQIDPFLDVNGRIFYDRKLILINEPTALYALTTLAHEGGHYLHYLRNPLLETNRSTAFRERSAYCLGWYLLVKVKAVSRGIITKQMWRENGIDPLNLSC